jgi:hypothetical protein
MTIGTKGAVHYGDTTAQAVSRRFYGAVDAETDLDNISEDSRVDGMAAVVLSDHSVWVFDGDSSATEATGTVRQPASGSGRWHIAVAGASGASGGVDKRSVTIAHGDLTAAATSEAIEIGEPLPANARIIGVSIHTVTPYSGGSVSAAVVDIGTSGDADAIVDGANVFAAAVDGQASTLPAGIAPNKLFAAAGAQLLATVATTNGNVADLTAGTITIDVLFAVLA